MDRAAHLSSIGRVAAPRGRIVGAAQFDDLARRILHDIAAGDEISVAQPHLAAGRKAVEPLWRVFEEIVALDVEFAAERDAARAGRRILRVVDRLQLFTLSFGIVLDDELQRTQHGHAARRALVQHVAHRRLEHADIDEAVGARDTDAADKFADRLGWHPATAQAGEGRHARIVPARDVPLLHEARQKPLR